MSTSPKQGQETPATPVFYSVGGAEDVGCNTAENLPMDAITNWRFHEISEQRN